MKHVYQTNGTCSRQMEFELDENNIIHNLRVIGGCNGNLQGLSRLVEGRKAEEIIPLIEGIKCGFKQTSCPDQFAQALKSAINK